MAHDSVELYLSEVGRHLKAFDGDAAGRLLSLSYTDQLGTLWDQSGQTSHPGCDAACSSVPGLKPVLEAVLRRGKYSQQRQWEDAFQQQMDAFDAFTKFFRQQDQGQWCVGLLRALSRDLRILALRADEETELEVGGGDDDDEAGGSKQKPTQQAGSKLLQAYPICNNDRSAKEDGSRKWGTLPLLNQILKLCFAIDQVQLVRGCIQPIEQGYEITMEEWCKADRVTYKFYSARIHILDEKFKLAEECLSYALRHCHKASTDNVQKIMVFLVPLRLMLGKAPPSEALLLRHGLHEVFWKLIQALGSGDVQQAVQAVRLNEAFLMEQSIYLLAVKLRGLAYRNLFRKVWLIRGRSSQLHIDDLVTGLRCTGKEADAEEVECIVQSLISAGMMRGKVIEHRHLVVLQMKVAGQPADPFPPVGQL